MTARRLTLRELRRAREALDDTDGRDLARSCALLLDEVDRYRDALRAVLAALEAAEVNDPTDAAWAALGAACDALACPRCKGSTVVITPRGSGAIRCPECAP